MSDPDDISPEDSELFRSTIGAVEPVQKPARIPHSKPRPKPHPYQTRRAEAEVLAEMANADMEMADVETGEELAYKRPGIQTQLFKRLRRGQFIVEAELDLHGLTTALAKRELTDFLTACRYYNRRCVRIIHGKGRGSPDGKPVLKIHVNHWLRLCDDVLAFCSARRVDGGTGAIYVLLRQQRKSSE